MVSRETINFAKKVLTKIFSKKKTIILISAFTWTFPGLPGHKNYHFFFNLPELVSITVITEQSKNIYFPDYSFRDELKLKGPVQL